MLVTIVSVANADNTGLDLDRLEKVEDHEPEVARKMVDSGSARLPSDDELEDYRKAQIAAVEQKVADAHAEAAKTTDMAPAGAEQPAPFASAEAAPAKTAAKKSATSATEAPNPTSEA